MQDDVTVVLQNPSLGFATFDTDSRAAVVCFHQLFDFFGDGSHLPAAGRRRHDEKINDRSDWRHVEHDGVLAFEIRN